MSGGFSSNADIIAANLHKAYVKFEYDGNSRIVYGAWHLVHGSADTHPKWVVTKYTYDGNGNLTVMEKLEGAWDDRATLDWV